MVDTLQYIFDFAFFVSYFQRIVNVSVSKGLCGNYFFSQLELVKNV